MVGDRTAFGALLRRYRTTAGLTQEALAEQAGLSLRGVSDLERGLRRVPYPETVGRLVEALGLSAAEQAALQAARHPRPGGGPGELAAAERGDFEGAARRGSLSSAEPPELAVPAERATIRTNVPAQVTSFVGRERELAEVKQLLTTTRLLTLTGTGGCGKTRMALQVATEVAAFYPDGVWFVDLAPLSDPPLVLHAVTAALEMPEDPQRPPLPTLVDFLRVCRLLLVIDNCEHLLDACAQVADTIVQSCPDVHILATSRERLGVRGEIIWRVPSLALPDIHQVLSPETLSRNESVRLFVERARAVVSGFAITERNAGDLAHVCFRLDGIPLAIELAAARARVLTLEQIVARLDDRFRLLTGGSRSALRRQQTLRALVDWSHDLLTDAERVLLRRLAVFAGGWTLEAAEAICADHPLLAQPVAGAGSREGLSSDVPVPFGAEEVLDLLTGLVDKSLVMFEGGEGRYRSLETIRAFGLEQLRAAGEINAMGNRHARYFLSLNQDIEPRLERSDSGTVLASLDRENNNLRAALAFLRENGDAETGLRLAGGLRLFWYRSGRLAEGRELTVGLLGAAGPVAPATRARALDAVGFLAKLQGDYPAAHSFATEALTIRRALGDRQALADTLGTLGHIYFLEGEHTTALALWEEGLQLDRALGNQQGIAAGLTGLGMIALQRGDIITARQNCAESLDIWRTLGDDMGIGWALFRLALVAMKEGRYSAARSALMESLTTRVSIRDQWGVAESLDGFGHLAAANGRRDRALKLAGAAAALSQAWSAIAGARRDSDVDAWLRIAQKETDADTAALAWAEGQAMTPEQAIAYALEEAND
jgi:predicted ATPase/transcriptional regulator with XRE-family HTH domain